MRMADLATENAFPPVFIHDCKLKLGEAWVPDSIGAVAPVAARLPHPAAMSSDTYPSRVMAFYECEPDTVAQLAWDHARNARGGAILVIDELDRLPPKLDNRHPAYRAVNYGRQYMLDVLGSSRRPANVDKCFFSEATSVALFRMEGHLDLAVLQRCGWSGAKQLATAVPKLADHQHLMAVEDAQ